MRVSDAAREREMSEDDMTAYDANSPAAARSEAACALRPERVGAGEWRLASPEATRALGVCLGRVLQAGDVLILTGDLGAGKTCLTGGVAQGLGDDSAVTSPTFTIMAVHDQGRIPLYHFDLYRLTSAEELDDVGIYDVLEADGACLIEWGEAYTDELGDERLDVTLTREAVGAGEEAGEPARMLRAAAHGQRAEELLAAWDAAVQELIAE